MVSGLTFKSLIHFEVFFILFYFFFLVCIVLLPGKSHGWRSLEGCSPWGH